MFVQAADVDIKNGTSVSISPDISLDPATLAGAYASEYMPDTKEELSWKRLWVPSWAFGLNGHTLEFSAPEFVDKLRKLAGLVRVRQKNHKAITLLEEWFADPDDLGPAFWEKFDKDLEANRFTI